MEEKKISNVLAIKKFFDLNTENKLEIAEMKKLDIREREELGKMAVEELKKLPNFNIEDILK